MIHAAICDNVEVQCQAIEQRVQAYFFRKGEEAICSLYTNTFKLLDDMEKDRNFDVILINTRMDRISGIETMKEMRRRKWNVEFIFLTDSPKFAVEAFALKAAYYLVQPFTRQAFDKAMDVVMMRIQQYHSQKVIFHLNGSGIQVEEIHHIDFLESNGHIQTIHLADGSLIEVRQSLTSLQKMLDKAAEGQFVSPSKGYIVNQSAIHVIKSDHIEIKGEKIPLVKRRYRTFLQNYFDFIFKH
jgi:DNA-binding LytR/AlgR family response regulator